jgi:hypothetical protein
MELNLTFTERVLIKGNLLIEDTYDNLIIRGDIISKIDITQDELISNKFEIINGAPHWDDSNETTIAVELTNPEQNYLSSRLKQLSDKAKLHYGLVQVYKTIVKGF